MASLVTCVVTSLTWCFCTATASLLSSCCGNDKPSTIPPSATSGRRRSVLLFVLAVCIAFAFQYGVAPNVTKIPLKNYVTESWTDGCRDYNSEGMRERCVGNHGVYRAMGSALIFFILAAIAVSCKRTANREAWPAKYVLFCFLCLASCFLPNEPILSDVYLQIARVGSVLFLIFEQLIILDLAYNWNESWVEKSNAADADEGDGAGKKWLAAILVSCLFLFAASLAAIGAMFHYFSGCAQNELFLAMTLVLSVVVTVTQLSGDEASLLSSAVIVSYATFLAYTAVSSNPNGQCNPNLGQNDVLGIVLGVGITLISLGWTGWSYTAEDKITSGGKDDDDDLEENLVDEQRKKEGGDAKITGVVTGNTATSYGSSDTDGAGTGKDNDGSDDDGNGPPPDSGGLSASWKLNLILGLLSCFVAMALTGWGSIESGGDAANPSVGRISMWMVVAAQWIVFALYEWSIIAPRLFPDRDFS